MEEKMQKSFTTENIRKTELYLQSILKTVESSIFDNLHSKFDVKRRENSEIMKEEINVDNWRFKKLLKLLSKFQHKISGRYRKLELQLAKNSPK
mmetsp:Transcript_3463/g.2927  ORF Transcript_3463/g.2927 Transcript_3463/m.2927 type:complete len:94 (-) Transcript_3463:627-908(-)